MSTSFAGEIEPYQQAIEFVLAQDECGADHGYVCKTQSESDFFSVEADKSMVPGVYLKAWLVAMQDFEAMNDMTAEQKQLRHYKIGFSENPEQYVVHFQALLLPNIENGKANGIIRSTFGRSVRYWVNKKSSEIDKRFFYKD